ILSLGLPREALAHCGCFFSSLLLYFLIVFRFSKENTLNRYTLKIELSSTDLQKIGSEIYQLFPCRVGDTYLGVEDKYVQLLLARKQLNREQQNWLQQHPDIKKWNVVTTVKK